MVASLLAILSLAITSVYAQCNGNSGYFEIKSGICTYCHCDNAGGDRQQCRPQNEWNILKQQIKTYCNLPCDLDNTNYATSTNYNQCDCSSITCNNLQTTTATQSHYLKCMCIFMNIYQTIGLQKRHGP